MTQQELRALPENLRPGQVRAVLGCGADALRVLREAHPELVVRKCGKGKQGQYIYSKKVVFEIGKIALEEERGPSRHRIQGRDA